jgi:hypothetical protein
VVRLPEPAQLVEEPREGFPSPAQPALSLDGALVLLETSNDVVDDALPRGLQVVVGPGRALAVATGVDGFGCQTALLQAG